ncbi:MAG: hypothetical protein M3O36_06090, partial [Myxococcota bacterium]|nr:hypothetical protein [Myxococcota bacterium]
MIPVNAIPRHGGVSTGRVKRWDTKPFAKFRELHFFVGLEVAGADDEAGPGGAASGAPAPGDPAPDGPLAGAEDAGGDSVAGA